MKNIAFIINPMSGTQNKRRLPKLIGELLDKRQWLENIVFTEREGHALVLAKQYATMGFDAVVAVGGDGTVREVAAGIAGSHSALGVIPMGTTNTLARHMGIPLRGNGSILWLNHSEPLLCDSLEITIDAEKPFIAMTHVTIGDEQIINCAQNIKTSIQDGILTVLAPPALPEGTNDYQRSFSGAATIDGDEYTVEHSIRVRLLQDNIYILAPKRF